MAVFRGTEQGLHRNEQPPPTQQGAFLKGKGLSQMLSLPEDWDYTLKGLSFINREKIDAIREAIMKRLERAGYIVRSRSATRKDVCGARTM